jgi:hypothetical protein
MGTRGYYIFKWRGVYYVFYSYCDSNPEVLGDSLVFLLRNVWSRMTDEQFGTFLLNKLVYAYLSNDDANPLLMTSEEDCTNYTLYFGEWTYTVDMDDNIFIANDCGAILFSEFCSNWIQVIYDHVDNKTRKILPKPDPVHDPIIREPSVGLLMPKEITVGIYTHVSLRDDYVAFMVPRYVNVFEALLDIESERLSQNDRHGYGFIIKKLLTSSLDWFAKEHRLNSRDFNGKKIIDDMVAKHPTLLSKDCAEQLTKDFYWKVRKPFVLLVAHVDKGSYPGSMTKAVGQVGLCMHIASYL